jgi:histidyl-tRNA synthetase
MQKPDVSPPAGTRDFFAEDLELRERVLRTVRTVFERHGFSPLETPAFEKLDIITGKYGEEEKLIFKILKRGEKQSGGDADLALRYDFTVPLARVVARYPDKIGRFFRRYQIGPVWRADRPGKGRFREFYQCDFDIVGSKSLNVEVEVFLLLADVLSEVGVRDFTIRINSRELLSALMEMNGVPPELHASVITAIDKLDKIGVPGVAKELTERGLQAESRDPLLRLVETYVADPESMKKQIASSPKGQKELSAIDQVMGVVQPLMRQGKLQFDPFLARGLSYYTGIIFEVAAEGIASSIASGGRYDNLIGMFSSADVPACGGSLGIERILMVLQSTGAMGANRTSPDVLVTVWDESLRPASFRFATHLRNAGINTEVYVGEGRIPEQIGYASKKGIPYAAVIGPDEESKNQVAVREMVSRKQTLATWDEAAQIVRGPAKV